jgi:hypothetical protein
MQGNAMSISSQFAQDLEHLGELAMRFRGTRDEVQRRQIAEHYAQTVDRLVASGRWDEMPTPEDQLPDAWMPARFDEYWARRLV